MYVIMRCDFSSVLYEDGKLLRFTTYKKAQDFARPFRGQVVTYEEAKHRLSLNKRSEVK